MAFVGQRTYFEACALDGPTAGIEWVFVDFRAGADAVAARDELRMFGPDVVVVFRPELIPDALLTDESYVTVGFLTEPLPRRNGKNHADLSLRLAQFGAIDRDNFDVLVAFDPFIIESAAAFAPVWRAMPLPVADGFFADPRPLRRSTKALFVGRSTRHREQLLAPAKHDHDVLHVAHGVDAAAMKQLFAAHDIGINLHNQPYPTFENRVSLHLAAGHLLLSEPLSPTFGLESGIDFLPIDGPGSILTALAEVEVSPDLYFRMRVRGRMKAEMFRASRLYPMLLGDLVRELRSYPGLRPGFARCWERLEGLLAVY